MEPLRISLEAARINAKMTQKDVAERLKVSNKTVSNWETGKIKPKAAVLFALCAMYGISEDNIFLPKEST